MKVLKYSLSAQLIASQIVVALVLALGLGVIVFATTWLQSRSSQNQVLRTAATLTAERIMAEIRRLDETRDDLTQALLQRPLTKTVEDILWLHNFLGYTNADRVEIFSEHSKLVEAYALLPGGNPKAATPWPPKHPAVAALLQSGNPVSWVHWPDGGEPCVKVARRVPAGQGTPIFVVLTLALRSSWLSSALPPEVTGSLLVGSKRAVSWPPGNDQATGGKFLSFAGVRESFLHLDDDTSLGVELSITPGFLEDAIWLNLRLGLLAVLAALLLAYLLGHTVARKLLSPLHDLLEGTAAISRGHLTVRLPVRRQDELGALTREFNRMADEIRKTYLGVISTLAEVVEAKSHYTREHIERVERLTMATAQVLEERGWVRWSSHQKFILSVAAILHDVGKIAISSHILNKAGPLSVSEREEILSHPDLGGAIVEKMGKLDRAAEIIRACHEHFNGTGYPRGLKGEQIPLEARIILAVDAFDAMTQARPYSQGRTLEDAVAELRAESGKQFDPVVVEALIEVLEREARGQTVVDRDSTGFYRSLADESGVSSVPRSALPGG